MNKTCASRFLHISAETLLNINHPYSLRIILGFHSFFPRPFAFAYIKRPAFSALFGHPVRRPTFGIVPKGRTPCARPQHSPCSAFFATSCRMPHIRLPDERAVRGLFEQTKFAFFRARLLSPLRAKPKAARLFIRQSRISERRLRTKSDSRKNGRKRVGVCKEGRAGV